jgi:membrane fusion protein (multidrug efflux system)
LPQLRLGQPVQLQLDAAPEQRATARVVAIDPLVDAEGRALLLRARIDSPAGNALRPGMFARVSLVIGEQPNALLVPEAALVPLGAQTVVYRIERAAQPGDPAQARRVVVRTGGRQAGWVQVLEGLQPGDSVVVAGQQRLQRELMPVRIVEPAAAAAGAKS